MTRQVQAVYEKGVLRPLEPLLLLENQEVSVTITDTNDPLTAMIDHGFVERARKEVEAAGQIPTLEDVRKILSKIPGSLSADIIAAREDRF
jgi:predicted DNA-binding antitoxin AbrB/MazE fold protein